jgi:hypothetical protein
MSVIFQTLKKMRSSPKQGLDVADPAPDRRHGCTLSGLLLSPPLLTAVLLVIAFSAVVTVLASTAQGRGRSAKKPTRPAFWLRLKTRR